MNKTSIEWVKNPDGSKGYSWNPVTGCSKGCPYCYAARLTKLRPGNHGYKREWDVPMPFTTPIFHPDRLDAPLKVKKPSRVFVCSMGELFDPKVSGRDINRVWQTIYNTPRHTFIILTKRPEIALRWTQTAANAKAWPIDEIWPSHVWLGVSCENQAAADERTPVLLQIPAAKRIVSLEPLQGYINLRECNGLPTYKKLHDRADKSPWLDWVIVGRDSSRGAPMPSSRWIQPVIDQCEEAGVPLFVKDNILDHYSISFKGDPQEWPE